MGNIRIKIAQHLQNDESFRAFLENICTEFQHRGTTIFSGRNTIKTMDLENVGNGGLRVVVKHFRKPDIFKKIAYGIMGSTKADRAFDNGVEMISRGFSTPEPYAAVVYKRCGFPQDYYLITAETTLHPIEDGMPYHESTGPFDKEMAAAFAGFAADLHSKGILHHDLNRTNVLYSKDKEANFSFSLIDINRMKFYPQGEEIPLYECMENMTRYTIRRDIIEFVARNYAKARGLDEEDFLKKAIAVKRAHDVARRRRKAITHPIRYISSLFH